MNFVRQEFTDEPYDANFSGRAFIDKPHGALVHENFTQNVPPTHETLQKMRSLITEANSSNVLVCETVNMSHDQLWDYYGGTKLNECHLPWNFGLTRWDSTWYAKDLEKEIKDYLRGLPQGAWPNFVLSSHDVKRVRTRLGGQINSMKLAYTLLLTLPGTPTIYYGDEIGMKDVDVPPELMEDTAATQYDDDTIRKIMSRDPARTPMRWNGSSDTAGFMLEANESTSTWLPIGDDVETINVATQQGGASPLSLVQALMSERNNHASELQTSAAIMLDVKKDDILSFIRPGLREGMCGCMLILANLNPKDTVDLTPMSNIQWPLEKEAIELIDSRHVRRNVSQISLNQQLHLAPLSAKVFFVSCLGLESDVKRWKHRGETI